MPQKYSKNHHKNKVCVTFGAGEILKTKTAQLLWLYGLRFPSTM
jgi:hypothetical protein